MRLAKPTKPRKEPKRRKPKQDNIIIAILELSYDSNIKNEEGQKQPH